MSAQDELPPGWEWQGRVAINHATGRHVSRGGSTEGNAALCWDAWRHKSGITREELATMRAAVERCAELASEVKTQGCMLNTQYLEAEDDRAKCEAWEERASKAEAALAERDSLRGQLAECGRCNDSMSSGLADVSSRLNRAEAALAKVTAERDGLERKVKGYESATSTPKEESKEWRHVLSWDSLRMANDRLRVELAKVTAERDEARSELDRALMDMAAGFAGIVPGGE